jgi:hypothetical protein
VLNRNGVEMLQKDFVQEYIETQNKSFKHMTITAAFKKSGIHPFNSNCLSKEDYAPSYSSSIHAHVPPSYPVPLDDNNNLRTQPQWTYDDLDSDDEIDDMDYSYQSK